MQVLQPSHQRLNRNQDSRRDVGCDPGQGSVVVMCAWTRRLKFDGQWLSVEDFLEHKFGLRVSHGISEQAIADQSLDLIAENEV